jgi:AraC-like DNA-binding protein
MDLNINTIFNTILFLGAIQGIILTVFLFNVKSNRLSNRLLGILTALWAILLLIFALQSYGLFHQYPHLLYTFSVLIFAWFPLLYLSVKYLISSHTKFLKLDLLHFIPMLFHILLFVPFYFKTAAEKLEIIEAHKGYYFYADLISEEILAVQGIVYTILALIIIKNYKRNIVDYQSNINSKVLNGYRVGIILALTAWVIGIVGAHVEKLQIDLGIDLFLVVYLIFVVIIYLLSILTLRSPEVFKLTKSELQNIKAKNELSSLPEKKYFKNEVPKNNGFESEKIADKKLLEELIEFMENEKPYLNPELSLQEMSEKLGASRHILSAVINQQQKMNFYEFVNNYRVKEIKELMNNPKNKNQNNYELAYDAGFNSKASFYRIFRQITHQTPSEYRAGLEI